MSSKLAIVSSALMMALLLSLAEATRYTTTVTTTMDEEEVENPRQMCQQQIQGREFRQCRMFLQSQQSEEETMSNPPPETLMQCCQQLRGVDMQCRCDAIRQMMMKAGGGEGSQQMMMPTAKYLPRICNMGPHVCEFQTTAAVEI